MKKLVYPALVAVTLLSSAFAVVNSNWKVNDDNYSVKFKGDKVEGVFKGLKSEINFDATNPSESKIVATIDANTVNTGNGMRNKHARQGLGAEKFSNIKFESTSIVKTSSGYEAIGRLTIRDVTKEIKLPFTFTKNSEGGIFNGKFTVKPEEYHVKKGGTPKLIEVELNVPVTK